MREPLRAGIGTVAVLHNDSLRLHNLYDSCTDAIIKWLGLTSFPNESHPDSVPEQSTHKFTGDKNTVVARTFPLLDDH